MRWSMSFPTTMCLLRCVLSVFVPLMDNQLQHFMQRTHPVKPIYIRRVEDNQGKILESNETEKIREQLSLEINVLKNELERLRSPDQMVGEIGNAPLRSTNRKPPYIFLTTPMTTPWMLTFVV